MDEPSGQVERVTGGAAGTTVGHGWLGEAAAMLRARDDALGAGRPPAALS
ncbi:MAG: hypothetical protein ACLPVF_17100 [Acidimicrobiales bacterium]